MSSRTMLALRVTLRATAALFGIVIVAVIEKNGFYNRDPNNFNESISCVFGGTENEETGNKNACKFGLAVGILALVTAIVLSAIDVGGTVVERNREPTGMLIIVGDLIVSVIMGFLVFVAFAYLVDLWIRDSVPDIPSSSKSSAGASIAFCFLSAIVWIVLVVLDALRLRSLPGSSTEVNYDAL